MALAAMAARRMVDEIVWVKMTVNRRMAKSHGYYLQHAKVRDLRCGTLDPMRDMPVQFARCASPGFWRTRAMPAPLSAR